MKHIALIIAALAACSTLHAQTAAPKPPIGVPLDARHFNGKWYRVYLEALPWTASREKCARLGGQLAVVPDAETWAFLKPLCVSDLWLGATDEETSRSWKWVDGTPMTFKAWNANQPDNQSKTEHYLAARSGGWDDARNDGKFKASHIVGFICEWKGKPGVTALTR